MNNISKTIIGVAAVLCTSTVVAAAGLNRSYSASEEADSSMSETSIIDSTTETTTETAAEANMTSEATKETTSATETKSVTSSNQSSKASEGSVTTTLQDNSTTVLPDGGVERKVGNMTIIEYKMSTLAAPTSPSLGNNINESSK